MQPYTYLIKWTKLGISYYGVRYAQDCNPSDLWNPYKTSSPVVKEFVALHGDPDVIKVRRIFEDKMKARVWEHRVLKKMKVVDSNNWLNKHDSMSPPINPFGNLAMRKPENREKARLNNSGAGNPMYGKKQRRVVCQHCNKEVSINTFNVWHGSNCETINPETKVKARYRNSGSNNPMYGKKQKIKKCECCSKKISVPNYTRWHGTKCKSNLTNIVANTDQDVYNNLASNI
jgi:hypothetical protein